MSKISTGRDRAVAAPPPPAASPPPAPWSTAKVRSRPRRLERLSPYLWVAPAVIYLLVFMAYPLFKGFQLSLTDTSLLTPDEGNSVGVQNYSDIVNGEGFWKSVEVTLVYSAASVVGALALGLGAALVMNRPMRGRILVRSAVTMPWAAPPIAVALIFVWMFNNQYGVVNYGLAKTGLIDAYLHWLDNEDLALVSLVSVTVWMTFPICALILLAALQSVPAELYEASKVDGANVFARFRYVTIPGIRPTLYVVTLFLTIWALRRFDIIWVMTQGGPVDTTTTLVVKLYRDAFQNQNLGLASAVGMFGFALSTLVTVVYYYLSKRADAAAGEAR